MTDETTNRGTAAKVAGAAALIGGLTILARVVGFGRTAVFGWTIKDTAFGELYQAVNAVPNMVYDMVAGGALASVLVPLLAGLVNTDDREQVSRIASTMLTWTLLLLVPVSAVVALAAGPIVNAIGVAPSAHDTAVRMLWVFAPQIPLYGVGVVLTGVLQAHRRFGWPAAAPLLSSVTVIGAYLAFAGLAHPQRDSVQVGRTAEWVVTGGTTAGVVVLSLCLLVPVRRLRLRWQPRLRWEAHLRRGLLGLCLAGAATVVGPQLGLLVAVNRALAGPVGTLVHVTFALAVYQLPWAVLAVPVATAVYPSLTAAHAGKDSAGYTRTLAGAGRAIVLLSGFGAAALAALAAPIAEILLNGSGRSALAHAIVAAAPGLLGYGTFALYSRALYVRGATTLAAVVTGAGWTVVMIAAVVLSRLAAATDRAPALLAAQSLGMTVLGALLLIAVWRRCGRAALAGIGTAASVSVLAGLPAAAAGWAVDQALVGVLTSAFGANLAAALRAGIAGVAVMLVFLAVAYPLDRRDVRPLVARLWARNPLRRRRRG